MDFDTVLRKALFIMFFYVIYYNLVFFLLKPVIFQDFFFITYITILYVAGIIDTLIRPLEKEKREEGNFISFIVFLFLINPFLLVLAIEENNILFDTRLDALSWIGLFVYLLAAIVVVMARVNLGKQGTGILVVREDHELITTGLYKLLRHPMYSGTLLGVIGFAFVTQSIFVSLITFVLYFWIFKERLKYEEKLLEETFGEKYQKYKESSYRLIPFLY
ncbi:MAG: methyltransferase family protein [Candidatus Hodarchaeales archaeon]|jgi:protein-S-isoprenylcysteine O-methyltransferase Ste14